MTEMVYRGPVLFDLGFAYLPSIGEDVDDALRQLFFGLGIFFGVVTLFQPFYPASWRRQVIHERVSLVAIDETTHVASTVETVEFDEVDEFEHCDADGRATGFVAMMTRLSATYSIGVLCRVASFLVTSLPSPAPHCRLADDGGTLDPSAALISSVVDIFLVVDAENGCGDLIFSGHTLFLILSVMLCVTYIDVRILAPIARVIVPFVIAPCFVLFTIVARRHYTVDIVVATYVTYMLWHWALRFVPTRAQVVAAHRRHRAAHDVVERGALLDAADDRSDVTILIPMSA